MYSYYDDIEEQMFETNKDKQRVSGKSVEQLTNDMIKLFVKENKQTILKDLTVGYVRFMKDTDNSQDFTNALSIVKDKFNTFMIDVYYDYRNINCDMSEAGYLRYANNKFNSILKQKYFIFKG